ncbi:hypothetical protein JXJ21_23300 [candidate division KSB1 bacterium]|nr:hypothetical protein [candidate division KSB1 bacterium]
MQRTLFCIGLMICTFVIPFQLQADIVDVERQTLERYPRELIDCPTGNNCPGHGLEMRFRMFEEGGLLMAMTIGVTNQLMVYGSYGGMNVLGEGPVGWNPTPGIGFRYKIRGEDWNLPTIAVGFDNQGYGAWIDSTKRYTIKSKGFYLVASKNHTLMNSLGLHGGINYSLEREDQDQDMGIFVGASLMIKPEASRSDFFVVHVEYDFAINDNGPRSFGVGKGYLNAGFRWAFMPELFSTRLFFEFDVRNILKNYNLPDGKTEKELYNNRILKVVLLEYF